MTDIPVIMSAPMVRATLREIEKPGTGKTMTRRLAWRDIDPDKPVPTGAVTRQIGSLVRGVVPTPWQNVTVGDRLWMRENFWPWKGSASGKTICYAADNKCIDHGSSWKGKLGEFLSPMTPSIHMPRWASRITLHVTAVKIERLQDISLEDIGREGIQWSARPRQGKSIMATALEAINEAAPKWRDLWVSLHGQESWDANPEVVAITFKPELANIDKARKAA